MPSHRHPEEAYRRGTSGERADSVPALLAGDVADDDLIGTQNAPPYDTARAAPRGGLTFFPSEELTTGHSYSPGVEPGGTGGRGGGVGPAAATDSRRALRMIMYAIAGTPSKTATPTTASAGSGFLPASITR
jgi:hypothetical protein